MKIYFMFKPCKTDAAFEVIPQGKVDRQMLIDAILKEFDGKIVADNSFLTLIDIGKIKISVSKNNKIMIRNTKDENKAREIANRIMRCFV